MRFFFGEVSHNEIQWGRGRVDIVWYEKLAIQTNQGIVISNIISQVYIFADIWGRSHCKNIGTHKHTHFYLPKTLIYRHHSDH